MQLRNGLRKIAIIGSGIMFAMGIASSGAVKDSFECKVDLKEDPAAFKLDNSIQGDLTLPLQDSIQGEIPDSQVIFQQDETVLLNNQADDDEDDDYLVVSCGGFL